MRALLRAVLTVSATVSLALSTGCTDDGAGSLDLVRAASGKTVAADTAQVSITVDTDIGGTATTLTGDGGFDLGGGQGVLSLNLGSLLAGTKLDARIVGETAYVVPPAFLAALVGKPFLQVDLALLIAQNPQFGPISSTANPVTSVDALRGATDAEEVGVETVRGENTTHYRGTLDLAAARRELDETAAASVGRLVALLRTDEVPYDVWLDGSGRVRRIALKTTTAAADSADGTSSTTSVTTELFEFGSEVDVTVPAPTEVADGNAILRTIAGSRSSATPVPSPSQG